MSKIIVGIVSHGHYDYIVNNSELRKISLISNVKIIIKDNIKDNRLKSYSEEQGYNYIVTNEKMGFGDNNNYISGYALNELSANGNDWFIIFNPDVEITALEFSKLIIELESSRGGFFAPNLFKDNNFNEDENSIRYFASYSDLLNPLKLKPINKPYNKDALVDKSEVEWASGAFLCITFEKFGSVNGFDPKYFMYFEDVDLCYRLNKAGTRLQFLKKIRAVHKGEYQNRSVLSKHFRWYLSSLFKFLNTQRQIEVRRG